MAKKSDKIFISREGKLWGNFPFLTFSDIQVKEVAVQSSLNASGHNGNDIIVAFHVEPEAPVQNVQGPVAAEGKQVVGRDRLCLAGLGNHVELRHDGNTLQVDGEGPQNLDKYNQNG